MADPFDWVEERAAERARLGLTRRLRLAGPGLIDFASNDYLGLANDPRVIEAACRAAREHGWGATASPLVCGWKPPHAELAEALAAFEGAEAAVLFATGFAANLGVIGALVDRGDAVYCDRLNHACLVEGARLSGASLRVYPHGDADRLEAILARERARFRRVLIATDGVFSMDGDLAPLPRLVALSERFEAMLLVDEAHGTGVFGPDGRGAASELGVADRAPVRVGTLSKALGSLGGFVAGPRRVIDHIINHAPPFIYSTALPPAAAAAAREALRLVEAEPWRRHRAREFGRLVAQRLGIEGITGPIVPFVVGDATRALDLAGRLRSLGFLVPAIRPPTVPRGTARLRISVSASHTEEQLNALVCAIQNLA